MGGGGGKIGRGKIVHPVLEERLSVEFLVGVEVTKIDADAGEVEYGDPQNVKAPKKRIPFNKLLLASGGKARTLFVPGCNLEGVHTLRNQQDNDTIAASVQKGDKAVIVGGGFIGRRFLAGGGPRRSLWSWGLGGRLALCGGPTELLMFFVGRGFVRYNYLGSCAVVLVCVRLVI